MNQSLARVPFSRVPSFFKLSARVCAVFAMALLMSCAWRAEAAAPTKTRTAHVRKSSEPVPVGRSSARRTKAEGKRVGVERAGAQKPGRAKAGSKGLGGSKRGARESNARARDVAPAKRGSKSGRRSRFMDEPQVDMPLMYRTRMGRHGRTRALTTRERLTLLRSTAIRNAAFEAAASASPLRGTREVLVHQNLMASDEGLVKIQNDGDLDRLRTNNELVDFMPSRSLRINPELPDNRRCARLWTVQFAEDLGQAFYEKFGEPLMVTSAARSVTFQRQLTHRNGNAAGIEGEAASPHLTGQAIDIGKGGMSHAQLTWMRDRLLPMMQAGEIDVEEEFRQACFHISVYRSYLPVEFAPTVKREVAQTVPGMTTLPAMPTTLPAMPPTDLGPSHP
jgi:uncharacterized protein YcbK (DUF882 family)